ncbi:hypothetical protein [Bacillus paralicheniformis]|uniref:hypothetical protein n=1 Tax=Bacillus paralicheniformis TaxID=1648923 RepID=UPI0030C765EE
MEQEIIIEKAKAGWAQEFAAEKQRLTDVLGKKFSLSNISAAPLFPVLRQNRCSI